MIIRRLVLICVLLTTMSTTYGLELVQEGKFANGEYGMTRPGDTSWNVASKVRPNRSVTVQQTMLALVEANPEAFINGNVNLLKTGYALRVPDLGEIRALSSAEAMSEVEYHNAEFESYRFGKQGTQLDGARRTGSSYGSTGRDTSDGELVLSPRNDSTVGDISDSGARDGRTAVLENELAMTGEDLDRARRANAEISTRLDELNEQMETLISLVSAKNEQIVLMQNEILKMQNAAASTPGPEAQPSGSLLTNTYIMGGLVLLGAVLAAGLLVFMRRRQQDGGDLSQPFGATQVRESMAAPDQKPSLANTFERSKLASRMESAEEDGYDLDLSVDDDELVLDMEAEDEEHDVDANEDDGTKLDLARAYIDMGDTDDARSLLQEVVANGSDEDVAAANELLSNLDD